MTAQPTAEQVEFAAATTTDTLTEARDHLAGAAKKLRRLADEINDLPTDRTLDVHVALNTLKKGAKAIETATGKHIGDAENGVMAELLAEFVEHGVSSQRHSASGKLAYINNRIFAGTCDGVERAHAAALMREDPELADFVEPGFNLNTVSSHYREQIKELEAQGVVITDDVLESLIPEPLRGVLKLTPSPVIAVRA